MNIRKRSQRRTQDANSFNNDEVSSKVSSGDHVVNNKAKPEIPPRQFTSLKIPAVPTVGHRSTDLNEHQQHESTPSPRNLSFKLSPIHTTNDGTTRQLKETRSMYNTRSILQDESKASAEQIFQHHHSTSLSSNRGTFASNIHSSNIHSITDYSTSAMKRTQSSNVIGATSPIHPVRRINNHTISSSGKPGSDTRFPSTGHHRIESPLPPTFNNTQGGSKTHVELGSVSQTIAHETMGTSGKERWASPPASFRATEPKHGGWNLNSGSQHKPGEELASFASLPTMNKPVGGIRGSETNFIGSCRDIPVPSPIRKPSNSLSGSKVVMPTVFGDSSPKMKLPSSDRKPTHISTHTQFAAPLLMQVQPSPISANHSITALRRRPLPSPKGSKDDTFATPTSYKQQTNLESKESKSKHSSKASSRARIGIGPMSPIGLKPQAAVQGGSLESGALDSSRSVQLTPNSDSFGKKVALTGLKALAAQANSNKTTRKLDDVTVRNTFGALPGDALVQGDLSDSGKSNSGKSATSVTGKSASRMNGSSVTVGTGYGVFKGAWVREKLIGRGQFGEVYLAKDVQGNKIMAVKQMRIQSSDMLEEMIQEVGITCRAAFRNDNVVMCFGWSLSDFELPEPIRIGSGGMKLESLHRSQASVANTAALIQVDDSMDLQEFAGSYDPGTVIGKVFNVFMEYVENGSLASVIEQRGPLNEVMLRNYTRQLLLGLRSLHAAGIAHRDIKCQNLLLSKDNTLKVADFGSAKRVAHDTIDEKSSVQGSIPWMSPEVIRQEVGKLPRTQGEEHKSNPYLNGWKKADIWSIGCTMIEMATGAPPWHGHSNPAALMYAIASCKTPPAPPKNLHSDSHHFLSLCFKLNPNERPSVAQLIYHDYLRPENVDGNGAYCNKTHKWV